MIYEHHVIWWIEGSFNDGIGAGQGSLENQRTSAQKNTIQKVELDVGVS